MDKNFQRAVVVKVGEEMRGRKEQSTRESERERELRGDGRPNTRGRKPKECSLKINVPVFLLCVRESLSCVICVMCDSIPSRVRAVPNSAGNSCVDRANLTLDRIRGPYMYFL
jgi:hypothetical protein